jgi:hypothetical protein
VSGRHALPTRSGKPYGEIAKFGLVIENGVFYVAAYGLGWDGTIANNVSKFVGIGIATLFRFRSYRTWVFRTTALPPEDLAPSCPEPVLSGAGERT